MCWINGFKNIIAIIVVAFYLGCGFMFIFAVIFYFLQDVTNDFIQYLFDKGYAQRVYKSIKHLKTARTSHTMYFSYEYIPDIENQLKYNKKEFDDSCETNVFDTYDAALWYLFSDYKDGRDLINEFTYIVRNDKLVKYIPKGHQVMGFYHGLPLDIPFDINSYTDYKNPYKTNGITPKIVLHRGIAKSFYKPQRFKVTHVDDYNNVFIKRVPTDGDELIYDIIDALLDKIHWYIDHGYYIEPHFCKESTLIKAIRDDEIIHVELLQTISFNHIAKTFTLGDFNEYLIAMYVN